MSRRGREQEGEGEGEFVLTTLMNVCCGMAGQAVSAIMNASVFEREKTMAWLPNWLQLSIGSSYEKYTTTG